MFIGDPATVVCFDQQYKDYTRTKVSDVDSCDWYVVADDALLEAISPCDPAVYDRVADNPAIDSLEMDEAVLRILAAAICRAYAKLPKNAAEQTCDIE